MPLTLRRPTTSQQWSTRLLDGLLFLAAATALEYDVSPRKIESTSEDIVALSTMYLTQEQHTRLRVNKIARVLPTAGAAQVRTTFLFHPQLR